MEVGTGHPSVLEMDSKQSAMMATISPREYGPTGVYIDIPLVPLQLCLIQLGHIIST